MSKIVFCNRYYRPDHSATAQILTDLAQYLAAQGEEVVVVTSRQRYEDAGAELPAKELLEGVTVIRIWTSRWGRAHLTGRAIDYLTFYLSSLFTLLFLVRRGDILVAKTDPPLLSVVAHLIARLKGAKLVNWLQDLFPEVAQQLGVSLPRVAVRLIRGLRNLSLRAAHCNVVIGEIMADKLRAAGVADEQILVIHNWCIERDIYPLSRDHNPLRQQWQFDDRFIVGYSGNLGRAHDRDTLFEAAMQLADDPRFLFLFIGSGAGMDDLKRRASQHRLANIHFAPYQPAHQLQLSLSLPDLHWVSLDPTLEGLIVPSKLYGVLAAGRPLLFIGAADGEIGQLLSAAHCGATFAPGQSRPLVDWLQSAIEDPNRVAAMSRAARRLYERDYYYGRSLATWHRLTLKMSGEEICRPA